MLNSAVLTIGDARPSGLRPVIDLTTLPANTRGKRLASGATAYYWTPPSRDRERDCTMRAQALGRDRIAAIMAAARLNEELQDWRDSVRRIAKSKTAVRRRVVRNRRQPRPKKLRSFECLSGLSVAA